MRLTHLTAAALATLTACSNATGPGPLAETPDDPVPPPELLAAIDGPSCVDRPGTYTFSAVVQPWDPTYAYSWATVDDTAEHPIGLEQRVQIRIAKDTDEVRLALRVFGPGGSFAHAEKTVRMQREDGDEPAAAALRLGAAGPLFCGS